MPTIGGAQTSSAGGSGPLALGKALTELNATDRAQSAVCGFSHTSAAGVFGISDAASGTGVEGKGATGVYGLTEKKGGQGVLGEGSVAGSVGVKGTGSHTDGEGVYGEGKNGVHGRSTSASDSGIWGENTGGGYGVSGSTSGKGASGVWGNNAGEGPGVKGTSVSGDGLVGLSSSKAHAGVTAGNDGGGPAGHFDGDVMVTGTVTVKGDVILPNADCAEDFEMAGDVGPGVVVVIESSGRLRECAEAYDRRVAGVISGAGEYRPGIILGRTQNGGDKLPVALTGRVQCKADARYAAIGVGDLLTTSPTPGHAMAASEPARAFGAVIGKALEPLSDGQGLIRILVALQ